MTMRTLDIVTLVSREPFRTSDRDNSVTFISRFQGPRPMATCSWSVKYAAPIMFGYCDRLAVPTGRWFNT